MLENNVVNRFPSLIYCNGLVIFPCVRLSFSFFFLIRFVFALKQSILKFSVTYSRRLEKYSKLMAYNNVASCGSKLPSESEKKTKKFVMKH
jgi:hypothetical protein